MNWLFRLQGKLEEEHTRPFFGHSDAQTLLWFVKLTPCAYSVLSRYTIFFMLEKSGPPLFFTPHKLPFESVPYRSLLQSPLSIATTPT